MSGRKTFCLLGPVVNEAESQVVQLADLSLPSFAGGLFNSFHGRTASDWVCIPASFYVDCSIFMKQRRRSTSGRERVTPGKTLPYP